MSSLALPRETLPARARPRAAAAGLERLGADAILVVVILTIAATLLVLLPSAINVDTWLALVTGRDVFNSGLPQHETLTAIAHGVSWINQQWLSQLAVYAIYRVGGLGLVGLGGALTLVAGVGGAAVAARRLGAPLVWVLPVLALGVLLIWPSREIRTQDFAVPLFVAVAYLLARDARMPSRRVYWCLALLVAWANLHGTVTLGATLVALRGVTVAWERRASLLRSVRAWRRPVALIAGATGSILITPYGLAIVTYYRETIFDGGLRQAVTEWQPITTSPVAAGVLIALGGIAAWALWRHPSATTAWERLALLLLFVASISVQRNGLFFALLAIMVVPVWLTSGRRAAAARLDARRLVVNGALIVSALLATLAGATAALARPTTRLELHFQRTGVLTAVQRATRADPALRVLGDVRYDDWLLWRDPALRGRIAFDGRYELLTSVQLRRLQSFFSDFGPNWKQFAHGYRLLVLNRVQEPAIVRAFMAERGRRLIYDDGVRVVILRSASLTGNQ